MGAVDPPGDPRTPLSAQVAGLLLAAGGGRRMGTPKALLVDDHDVPYIERAIGTLFDGGCSPVTVVLGAAAVEASEILETDGWAGDPDLHVVIADDWAEGMGASLRAGLAALGDALAVVVMLVDLPDVHDDAVRRLLERSAPGALVRATYDGQPGHPVLIGRDHWPGVIESTRGDRGARQYLDAHGVEDIPCDDLATGLDLDRPEDLTRPRRPD